jgi:hypothetical protein
MPHERRSETSLYRPVKRYLETLGFTVKGEVCGCDLVAIRGDEPPVVVIGELKLSFSLDLVLQAVDRTYACDEVWLAVGPRRAKEIARSACADFKYDGLGAGTLAFNNVSGIGRGGTGVLKVDGKEVARQTVEHTIPLIMQWDENFDIGADTGTPVDDADYQVPFKFTGKLDKLTLKIDRPTLTQQDIEKLKEATRNNRAAE